MIDGTNFFTSFQNSQAFMRRVGRLEKNCGPYTRTSTYTYVYKSAFVFVWQTLFRNYQESLIVLYCNIKTDQWYFNKQPQATVLVEAIFYGLSYVLHEKLAWIPFTCLFLFMVWFCKAFQCELNSHKHYNFFLRIPILSRINRTIDKNWSWFLNGIF